MEADEGLWESYIFLVLNVIAFHRKVDQLQNQGVQILKLDREEEKGPGDLRCPAKTTPSQIIRKNRGVRPATSNTNRTFKFRRINSQSVSPNAPSCANMRSDAN
jgi:hypothetical protein